jgi:putative flippase GtrA
VKRPLVKSLAVSVCTMTLDMSLFALCFALIHSTGTLLLLARFFCGALGALSNFLLNRRLAFRSEGSPLEELGKYAIVAASAVTLATLLWWILDRQTAIDPRVLHPLSAALVWLGFTYPMLKKWVFANIT